MTDKQTKIQRALKQKQASKQQDELAQFIAKHIGGAFEVQVGKIATALGIVAAHLKEVELATKANNITLPATQKVEGKVAVANPEALKTKVQKVEVTNHATEVTVKNQIDLNLLREDLWQIVRAANEVVGTSENYHREELLVLRNFLQGLVTKQDAELQEALKPLRFLTNDPRKPLSVRLSNGEQFYEAIAGFTQAVTTAAGGTAADLTTVVSLLTQIEANTDGLELSVGNIELNTDTINLNTDELEARIGALTDAEATGDGSLNAILKRIRTLLGNIAGEDFATETTLNALLTAFNAVDFATEATLNALLTAFNAEDFATETTLAALKAVVDLIKAKTDNLDVALSTRASEATALDIKTELVAIKGFVDGVETLLTSIDGKDFATETTLLTVKAELTAIKGFVDEVETKLDTIISLLGGAAGTCFNAFGEITLATTTETLVATYTVPTAKVACVKNITVEGEGAGLYLLYKNSVKQWAGRINQTQPAMSGGADIQGVATDVFELKVTPDAAGAATRKFRGAFSGTQV